MPTLITDVGGSTSNSYATSEEAAKYFDERLPLPTPWVSSGEKSVPALIQATRVLDSMAQARKTLRSCSQGCDKQYYTSRTWTGAPATTTQRLAWPRVGMFDRHGRPIPEDVIPEELKEAQSELAGQLIMADTTLDNAASVQGLRSVSAGSVSVSFKDDIEAHVLPDAVVNLLPPSWFTDEIIEPAGVGAMFDVVSVVL